MTVPWLTKYQEGTVVRQRAALLVAAKRRSDVPRCSAAGPDRERGGPLNGESINRGARF